MKTKAKCSLSARKITSLSLSGFRSPFDVFFVVYTSWNNSSYALLIEQDRLSTLYGVVFWPISVKSPVIVATGS